MGAPRQTTVEVSALPADIVFDGQAMAFRKAGYLVSDMAAALGIGLAELTGPTRRQELVQARSLAVWLVRRCVFVRQVRGSKCRSLAYNSIRTLLGQRDHSTLIYSELRCDYYCAVNPRLLAVRRAMLLSLTGTIDGPDVDLVGAPPCAMAPSVANYETMRASSASFLKALRREHPEYCGARAQAAEGGSAARSVA